MAVRTMPDQQFLRECFDYEPWSGHVWWRVRPRDHFELARAWKRWNTMYPGLRADSTAHKFGHRQMALLGQNWLAHRLIYKWMTGEDVPEVDHRNRKPAENWWENLRPCTRGEQRRNSNVPCTSRTGLKGASLSKGCCNRWTAKIKAGGQVLYLGSFDSPEEAHAAYCKAAQEHFGEFWSPG